MYTQRACVDGCSLTPPSSYLLSDSPLLSTVSTPDLSVQDTAKDAEMGQIQDSGIVEITLKQGRQKHSYPNNYNTGLAVGSAVGASDGGECFLLGSSVGTVEGDGPRWMGTFKNWPYSSMGGFQAQGPGRGWGGMQTAGRRSRLVEDC